VQFALWNVAMEPVNDKEIKATQSGRRKFLLRAGLGSLPVLLTLKSKSAWGTSTLNCSLSENASQMQSVQPDKFEQCSKSYDSHGSAKLYFQSKKPGIGDGKGAYFYQSGKWWHKKWNGIPINQHTKFNSIFQYGYHGTLSEAVNLGGNKTDTIELFKYNSSDETWKIANPYGRDLSEIARVGGAIFNLPVVGDTLAVMSKKAKVLKDIPMTARVMIANYLGLKGDKAIEWARGYGEEEFAGAENLGDVNWSGFATDLSDWSGAAISGAFYKGADAITQYFTKGKKPGLVDLGPDMVKAANALGVEPLVYAQIVANPIIRRLFNTSGEFVTTPGTVRADQAKSLLKSLQKYGISDQTQATIAKNIAEGVPDQNILSLQQVIDLEDALKLKLGDAMKVFGNDFPTNDTLKQNLDEVLSDLNVVQNNKKNHLTSKVFGTKKQGFKTGVSNIDGSFVNLSEFRKELTKQLKPFRNKLFN